MKTMTFIILLLVATDSFAVSKWMQMYQNVALTQAEQATLTDTTVVWCKPSSIILEGQYMAYKTCRLTGGAAIKIIRDPSAK